ncbi:MAG: Iron-sulfur cluster repair protein YtfE [Candidatus Heimdallarchaeota archaeon LC_3]|nr:MAG: Iron-sulfur cluster repair protein YtfE [Candidatus Heimdallarchaeota archaeon LC_3]
MVFLFQGKIKLIAILKSKRYLGDFLDPIEQLLNEHVHIKSMLNVLTNLIENNEEDLNKSLDNLKNILDFLSAYADKFHHGKEEEILFFELNKLEFFQNHQIINEIEDEHDQGRYLINEIKNILKPISIPLNEQTEDKLKELIWDYIDLLTQHIEKEDKILFPTIQGHLNTLLKEKITKKFLNVEESIGKNTIEKQLENLKNLTNLYK